MSTKSSVSARDEWRRHWLVVMAGMIGVGLVSIHVYTQGPFIGPLEKEFGWKRAEISSGLALSSFILAGLSPFMGMAIDRWGARRIALPGCVLFLSATAMLSQISQSLWTWWAIWIVVGMGGLALKPTIWTLAVASLFDKGRGFALAVTLCGTALASGLMPLVATALIDQFGWRQAYPLMALLLFVIAFPVFWFFLDSAADKSRRGVQSEAALPPQGGATFREAVSSLRFYQLSLAAFVFTAAALGIISNLVPILTSMEIGRTQAAAIAGLAGVTNIVGRLTTGWLLDRYNGNVVGGLCVAIPVSTCLLLLFADGSMPMIVLAVAIMGLSLGAEMDVIAFLTARHFGMARYGTIFGTVSALWSFAVSVGPILANHIYDRTGAYDLALWIFLPLFLIASLSLLTLGQFPDYSQRDAASAP